MKLTGVCAPKVLLVFRAVCFGHNKLFFISYTLRVIGNGGIQGFCRVFDYSANDSFLLQRIIFRHKYASRDLRAATNKSLRTSTIEHYSSSTSSPLRVSSAGPRTSQRVCNHESKPCYRRPLCTGGCRSQSSYIILHSYAEPPK